MLHRSYTAWWSFWGLLGFVVEMVALRRGRPGDTLSEHIWTLVHRWPGAMVCALLAWVLLWHFPFGKGRPLGWPDVLAVAAGVAIWAIGRANGGTP